MPFLPLLLALLSLFSTVTLANEPPPALAARAWILIDHATGQVLAAQNPDQKVEPASLTKIMTSYITYAALRDGKLKRDQVVPVSEKAWKAVGSRMFIDLKVPVTVDELLHGMVIQSGNDASIALAEAIAGSEEAFANLMNAEAKRLGLANTHYVNATGMPDPAHMTTASDLARLTTALIRDFPEDYKGLRRQGFHLQQDQAAQPQPPAVAGQHHRRRQDRPYGIGGLLPDRLAQRRRAPPHCRGARHRLRPGARAGNAGAAALRLSRLRRREALRQGPGAVATQDLQGHPVEPSARDSPRTSSSPCRRAPAAATISRSRLPAASRSSRRCKKGDTIATLRLSVDGQLYGEYPLVALADVPVAGIIGRAWDSLKLYLQ